MCQLVIFSADLLILSGIAAILVANAKYILLENTFLIASFILFTAVCIYIVFKLGKRF